MNDPDPEIHQPTRLRIMMLLSALKSADFTFLVKTLGLTDGNLSAHMQRLESAGHVKVMKEFEGKVPRTSFRLTPSGRSSLAAYWKTMDAIRSAPGPSPPRGSRG
ncbi:MAG TPA: transcriptional regulator [Vicinamibacteria bacterium]|nr:transcriptional regulator [Vicinamibacteria bacterium]